MQENMFHDWLKKRHISDLIINEFDIHTGNHPIIGKCIIIPILNSEGEFSFNKYRRNPMQDAKPKYLYDKGGKITLYGWFKAKQIEYNSILITEGEMDCLVAWSNNIASVTGTGGAMSFPEEWKELLKNKDITILFDNDPTGGAGMAKVLKLIPKAYIAFLPDRAGIKDISDYVSSGGDLNELLRTRKHFACLQDVIDDKAERQAMWQSTFFHDAYIEQNTIPEYVQTDYKITKSSSDMLNRSKQYSITNLLKFNREKKTNCIWHSERTSSLHYYEDTNTVYCFGCGKHADSIDVYRQINNCSFKKAIDELSKI